MVLGESSARKTYKPEGCSRNFMIEPSERWTSMAGSVKVSIVTRHTLRTSDKERMLAIELQLYQTLPRVWEFTNHVGVLETAIREGAEDMWAASNVAEHVAVVKHRDG
jgi:hypothetical protein